jgi:hypothetical protein
MANKKLKETDLFEPVKAWLEERGWEVYSEVETSYGRADIVVKQHPAYGVVEMKTSLTHDLIDQALRWVGCVNYIWIAIPYRSRRRTIPQYVKELFKDKGIGVLEVRQKDDLTGYFPLPDIYSSNFESSNDVYCSIPARFNRIIHRKVKYVARRYIGWEELLTEEHKTWLQGGSSGGGYVTPYKMTMKKVKEFLRKNRKWVSIKEILDHCETHYASPKSSLANALLNFEREWCEAQKIDGKWYFRYKEEKQGD